MQLLECSPLGLRSARQRLTSPNSPVSVTLFPMVHVGDAAFFDRIYRDAFSHDVVLVEGVGGPVARRLTRTYRSMANPRLGLVVQPPWPKEGTVPARIVHADLTAAEFDREWRRIPLGLRLLVFLLVPVVSLRHRFWSTRESIARHKDMDDYRSRDETLAWDPAMAAFRYGVIDARDARLVDVLASFLDQPAPPARIAIPFGAQHMRAVLVELGRRGFRSVDSSWETVFYLD
jgi:hypothetical protein